MDMSQIVKKVTVKLNSDEETVRLNSDMLIAVISEELQKGNDISLGAFGEFCIEMQDAAPDRTRDAPTGAGKAVRRVVFVPGAGLEELVNRW